MRILTISGSLRGASSNSILLRAAALLAPEGVTVESYDAIADLPYFNPDLDFEGSSPPPAVADLRTHVGAADALLLSSPEYAHGVPGVLKNALDWLVSGVEIVDKPVGLLNASPRSTYAHAQLAETLRTMSAKVVPEASIALAIAGRRLDEAAIVSDPLLSGPIRDAIAALLRAR